MNASQIRKVTTIANSFTKELLKINGGSSKDMCFMVCAPLAGYLQALGYDCENVEGLVAGWHHYWIGFSDGTIIDPTADQFNDRVPKNMPKVYVGPLPEWYRQEDPEPESLGRAR